jgi:lysozyme
MKTSQKGIDLIKRFEGLKLTSYLCPAKIQTIGYGTTRINNKPVPVGLTITEFEADRFLRRDLLVFESAVKRLVKVTLNQNQFDALVSFVYNVGIASLQRSTLLDLINKNPNDPAIRAQFMRWNIAGGRALTGLTRRRTAEANLYFSK